MNEEKWLVIKTTLRAEKKVKERLENANFQTYLPLITTLKIWSDRKKKVKEPLIASTIFVYTSLSRLPQLYPIQGFNGVLMFLKKPAVVREYEINNMRILLQQDDFKELETTSNIYQGEKVEVILGSFKGLIAKAIVSEKFRLLVEFESMDAQFVVNIPKSYVRKIKT